MSGEDSALELRIAPRPALARDERRVEDAGGSRVKHEHVAFRLLGRREMTCGNAAGEKAWLMKAWLKNAPGGAFRARVRGGRLRRSQRGWQPPAGVQRSASGSAASQGSRKGHEVQGRGHRGCTEAKTERRHIEPFEAGVCVSVRVRVLTRVDSLSASASLAAAQPADASPHRSATQASVLGGARAAERGPARPATEEAAVTASGVRPLVLSRVSTDG